MRIKFTAAVSMTGMAIAMVCGASTAQAQQAAPAVAPNDDANAIVVTGLRKSLKDAVDIKRNTQGVVDAITSEDIGKLPDTNLAESIQRIPGVTIDRNNNEGSRVTVRGFGPEFNLVTLNGRSMPGSGTGGTRSFDFANISADGVSGIDVFKTGRADVASGGIGSTIDIHTARPFDHVGLRASAQVKGTDDTSRSGFRVTPEVSGLISDTFADDRIGLLLNGSYSERNSELQSAYTRGWLNNVDLTGANVTNNSTNPTGNVWAPQDTNWAIENHHRIRVNGQAVLQFKPTDTIVGTIDYTYALYKDHSTKSSFGSWFGYGTALTSATIDKNGTMTNLVDAGSDLSYTGTDDQQRNQLGSLGGNVKWQAFDNLTITADGHHSFTTSTDENQLYIVGQDQNYSINKIFDSTQGTIPTTTWTYQAPYNVGNLNTSLITPLFGQHNYNYQRTGIDEGRLDAEWKNNADSGLKAIKVGVDYKDTQTRFTVYNSGNVSNGYYDPRLDGQLPASLFTKVNSSTLLNGISGGGSGILVPYFYTFSPIAVMQALAHLPNYNTPTGAPGVSPTYPYSYGSTPATDNLIKERTFSAYAQMQFDTDFNGMRFKAQAGLRYEHTSVTSASLQNTPVSVTWNNPTEFQTQFLPGSQVYTAGSSYNDFLPSLDASLQITKKLLARASYSTTITRSDLNSLVSTQVFNANPHVGSRFITSGNPALLPYTSQNLDFTLEYYVKNNSYFSANYFVKQVANFITQTTSNVQVPGLTDASLGPIATRATAEVVAAGQQASPQNVFAQMVRDTGQQAFVGQPTDPVLTWALTKPSNGPTVNIHGFEFAGQYVFGETGFGLQANVSLPAGGARYDNNNINNQFALPGLSKSYNIVGFYEKNGFQTRVAWTHRDAFLAALSQQLYANQPTYTAAYGQLDGSASYDLGKRATVFIDAVNILGASQYQYGRYTNQFLYAAKGAGRYQVGVRVKY